MTAQTSSVTTLSDHLSSRSSTLLSISIKSDEDETGETDPKLLDLSLTRSHDGDEPDQEPEELGAFALNETRLILLGQEVVQVSLDLDGTRETDLKPLLKVYEQRRSQITDIIVTILHLQLNHHPLPDHFILLDSEFELNCYQQSWTVMRSRWSWSLNGRPIEGRKKKWRFVLGAPLKPCLV